jgi:hypothetical protein
LELFRRVARALLRASRGRAARKVIHDYRHLLPEQTGPISFQQGRKGMTRESQTNLRGISRKIK